MKIPHHLTHVFPSQFPISCIFIGAAGFAAVATSGCADDLAAEFDQSPHAQASVGSVATQPRTDGSNLTTIDARDENDWIHFSFAEPVSSPPAETASPEGWDLAFARFHIRSNGGISGNGGVRVAIVDRQFDDVQRAPREGFLEDKADGPDDNNTPDYAFHEWYSYDTSTHVLTPKMRTYIIRTANLQCMKVAMTGYYDEAGTSGYPTFEWAPLPQDCP